MASGLTVKVAMRPLYTDFITSVFAKNDGEVYASTHHKFGQLVKSLLQKTPLNYKPKVYDHFLKVILPEYEDLNNLYNNYLSLNSEKIIRTWVRQLFYFELHNHIVELNLAGVTEIKLAILNFCDKHNIHPDHYKENSLYKDYYRYRMKEKCVKTQKIASCFAALLSVICPLAVLSLSYPL